MCFGDKQGVHVGAIQRPATVDHTNSVVVRQGFRARGSIWLLIPHPCVGKLRAHDGGRGHDRRSAVDSLWLASIVKQIARRLAVNFGLITSNITRAIKPGGIEFFSLGDRIENTEIRCGIGAAAGHPLPTGRIVGGIGIDQAIPEPLLATPPIDQQMLDQERGANMRTRLCIEPVCQSSRMPASTRS